MPSIKRKHWDVTKVKAEQFAIEFYNIEHLEFTEVQAEDGSKRYTTEMQFFPVGKFTHPWYGELNFDDKILRAVVRNFDNKVLGTDIALDERHDHGAATAWVKNLRFGKKNINAQDVQGVFGNVEWTPKGRQLLEDKLYKYFSPEIGTYEDPKTGKKHENVLLGGGLTNRPFLKVMPALEFEAGKASNVLMFSDDVEEGDKLWEFVNPEEETRSFSSNLDLTKHDEEEIEEEDTTVKLEELIAKLNKEFSLDLKDEAGLTSLLTAGADANKELDALREKLKAEGYKFEDKTSTVDVVTAVLTANSTKVDALEKKVTEINGKFEDKEAEAAVAVLVKDGYIVPAKAQEYQSIYKMDRKLFDSIFKDAPKVVKLGEVGGNGNIEEPGSQVEFEDPEKATVKGREYLKLIGMTPKSEAKAG